MSKTLGLGLICKNEELVIERVIGCYKSIFDQICVVDTGSTDNTINIIKGMNLPNLHLIEVKIEPFNFADARNVYTGFLNEKVDFVYSCDCDDVCKEEHLNEIQRLTYSPYSAFAFQYRTGEDTKHTHWRMWKTKQGICWAGPVHEYLVIPNNLKGYESKSELRHDPIDPKHYQKSAERNLKIFEDKQDKNHRELFYYANTLRDLSKYPEALEQYQKYLDLPGNNFQDELLHVYWYKAYTERILGRSVSAQVTIDQGLSVDPTFCELLMEGAYNTLDKHKKYEYAIRAANIPYRPRLFNLPCNYKDGLAVSEVLNATL